MICTGGCRYISCNTEYCNILQLYGSHGLEHGILSCLDIFLWKIHICGSYGANVATIRSDYRYHCVVEVFLVSGPGRIHWFASRQGPCYTMSDACLTPLPCLGETCLSSESSARPWPPPPLLKSVRHGHFMGAGFFACTKRDSSPTDV
jgi:hypothetical protein